jgi:hypothetical protein
MSLSIEYRGYSLRYDENQDTWTCYDCKVDALTLGKLKKKIDKLHLEARKAAAVECVQVSASLYNVPRNKPVTPSTALLVEYKGEKHSRSHRTGERSSDGHDVSYMQHRERNERPSRMTAKLHTFAFLTPEVTEQYAAITKLRDDQIEIERQIAQAFALIPRLKIEDISGLVAAGLTLFDEADDG